MRGRPKVRFSWFAGGQAAMGNSFEIKIQFYQGIGKNIRVFHPSPRRWHSIRLGPPIKSEYPGQAREKRWAVFYVRSFQGEEPLPSPSKAIANLIRETGFNPIQAPLIVHLLSTTICKFCSSPAIPLPVLALSIFTHPLGSPTTRRKQKNPISVSETGFQYYHQLLR